MNPWLVAALVALTTVQVGTTIKSMEEQDKAADDERAMNRANRQRETRKAVQERAIRAGQIKARGEAYGAGDSSAVTGGVYGVNASANQELAYQHQTGVLNDSIIKHGSNANRWAGYSQIAGAGTNLIFAASPYFEGTPEAPQPATTTPS